MKQSFHSRRRQAGFSLIEIGIVLVIVAIIAVLVYSKYSTINNRRIAQAEADRVSQLISNIRARYSQVPDFNGITPAIVINNGAAPSEMVSGTTLKSGWATTVSVAPATLSTANDAFQITYTVPKQYCSEFVQAAAGSAQKVTVGSGASPTVIKDDIAGTAYNVAAVGTACSAGATATVNFIAGS